MKPPYAMYKHTVQYYMGCSYLDEERVKSACTRCYRREKCGRVNRGDDGLTCSIACCGDYSSPREAFPRRGFPEARFPKFVRFVVTLGHDLDWLISIGWF